MNESSQVLKRLNYPAYCIKLLGNNLIALAGGGGTSNTGVGNSIEIGVVDYKTDLSKEVKSHEVLSGEATLSTVSTYEPNDAIMKFISFSVERRQNSNAKRVTDPKSTKSKKFELNDTYLAAAVNNSVEIYKLVPTISHSNSAGSDTSSTSTNTTFNRKSNKSASTPSEPLKPAVHLTHVTTISKICSSPDDSVVSLASCKMKSSKSKGNNVDGGVFLCVGTSKGSIVIFKSQYINGSDTIGFHKEVELIEAHGKSDVDDLQANSSNENEPQLLSIAKDKCFVWSLKTFKKLTELVYTSFLNNDSNMRMKHARFSLTNVLYTSHIPRIRGGGRDMSSYLIRWSCKPDGYVFACKHRMRNTVLTAIQSSKDGKFVCVGDCDGQIDLFDANFNKLINFKRQHSSVITDLVFYYDHMNENDNNKLILTISIDRSLQCYKYISDKSNGSTAFSAFSKLFAILLIFLLLFCYFFTFFE
jgi:hypothetical protein